MLNEKTMPQQVEDSFHEWLTDVEEPPTLLDVFEYIRDNFSPDDVFEWYQIEDIAEHYGMVWENDTYEDMLHDLYYDR